MAPYSVIALVSSLAGCVSIWLSSPHQSFLRHPVSARIWRPAGGCLMLVGMLLLCRGMQPLAAIFLFLTWVMVWSVALPYLGGFFSLLRSSRS